jgi:hypothetical protein
MILRIRRNLVALLVLALGLTGVLLATLSGTAGSAPRDTTVITSVNGGDNRIQPGGMGYDGMGYDSVLPGGMGYDSVPSGR